MDPTARQRVEQNGTTGVLGRILWIFRLVVLLPLIIPLVVVLYVVVLLAGLIQWIWLIGYRVYHHDRVLLVCTTRHGWRELIVNNLGPVLPESVRPVWFRRRQRRRAVHRAILLSRIELKRPYLAVVRYTGIKAVALHERLLPVKHLGKRDPEVQTRLAPIVADALARLS